MSDQRIDFYIVQGDTPEACDRVVCQLADKAWSSGVRLFIRATDRQQATRLDELLWTFRQSSFLPHALLDAQGPEEAAGEPILLGQADAMAPDQRGMLINLAPRQANDLQADLQSFPRIAEVACRRPDLLEAARERFRHYRDQGRKPKTHNVAAAPGE